MAHGLLIPERFARDPLRRCAGAVGKATGAGLGGARSEVGGRRKERVLWARVAAVGLRLMGWKSGALRLHPCSQAAW